MLCCWVLVLLIAATLQSGVWLTQRLPRSLLQNHELAAICTCVKHRVCEISRLILVTETCPEQCRTAAICRQAARLSIITPVIRSFRSIWGHYVILRRAISSISGCCDILCRAVPSFQGVVLFIVLLYRVFGDVVLLYVVLYRVFGDVALLFVKLRYTGAQRVVKRAYPSHLVGV